MNNVVKAELPIALVSFDLDGTLVDTAPEIAEAANLTLEHYLLGRMPTADIILLIGQGAHALMRQLLKHVHLSKPEVQIPDNVDAVLATYDKNYAITTGTTGANYPGAREALDSLLAAGVRLACVTNKEEKHAHRVLEVNGLHDAFEIVVGGDTLPEKKPHPSVLTWVANSLDIPLAAMAHVGDSATDVKAAKVCGIAALAVPYGYNAGEPIETAGPDRIFATLPDVASFVIRQRSQLLR